MTKLQILANNEKYKSLCKECDEISDGFKSGFKKAFEKINEALEIEIKRISEYPHMGERIISLKVYQKKVDEVLKDMEKEL